MLDSGELRRVLPQHRSPQPGQRAMEQQAADQQAAADAAAQAAAQKAAQQVSAFTQFSQACTSRTGAPQQTASGQFLCNINYPDPTYAPGRTYQMPMKPDGSLDATAVANEQADCAIELDEYNQSGTPGWGPKWAKAPVFHPDTGVCDRGHP